MILAMQPFYSDYQIVATLGPSSGAEATWRGMLSAGVTGFRLNTSHLSIPQLQVWLERLAPFLAASTPRPPLVLDLQGSKWRLGQFPGCTLAAGQRVRLVCAPASGEPDVLPVPHPDFFRAAPVSSGEIALNDAKLRLRVESLEAQAIGARVEQGGAVLSRKGITYTQSPYRQESLNDTDRAVLECTQRLHGIRYALSYVKDAAEMALYRWQIPGPAFLIAKLERQPALDEATQIAESSDEVWVCRGDLGAELGPRAMAAAVYRLSECLQGLRVPVLLAGQVLEHMAEHATPTRSEVCVMHDALLKGYQGFVLSDETAIGRDPVASCRVAAMFRPQAEP